MRHAMERVAALSAVAITAMMLAACSGEGCRFTKMPDTHRASACALGGRVYVLIGTKNKDGRITDRTIFSDGSFLVREWQDDQPPDSGTTEIYNPDGRLADEDDPGDSDAAKTKAFWDYDTILRWANAS